MDFLHVTISIKLILHLPIQEPSNFTPHKYNILITIYSYTVGAFPIFAGIASSLLIYNFNMFSWAPLTAFMMFNLFFDAKATERSLTPRYWMTYKTRFTLFSIFFLFVTSLSLLTFKDYVSQLEDMLATYRDKADPEAAARTLATGPTEKQFRSFVKTP
jgi:hypothetical protein